MTTMTTYPVDSNGHIQWQLRAWFSRMWNFNWFVTSVLLIHVVAIPIYLVAAIVDPRMITNAPAFVKPLKFVISIAIYLGTFLALMMLAQRRRWWVHLIGNITALGLLMEITLITTQAIRGVPSHFNMTTPFNAMVYNIMGSTIVVVSIMNLLMGIWLLFQRLPDSVVAWALRMGVFISLAGMVVAFLMTSVPTPAQRAQMEAGEPLTSFGAHSVGVEDGGPGLPFVGWSTEGGDLRIAHFVGLHGMQAMPLLAFVLNRTSLNRRQRMMFVIIGGLAYVGWLALLTWQALRGQSIVAPDALTWNAYAGLVGFVLISTLSTLRLLRQPELAPGPATFGSHNKQ